MTPRQAKGEGETARADVVGGFSEDAHLVPRKPRITGAQGSPPEMRGQLGGKDHGAGGRREGTMM